MLSRLSCSLFKGGKDNGSIFSILPEELRHVITNSVYSKDLESDIAKALHYAAFARAEDVTALLALLEENPTLLLEAGDVKTPGGDEIKGVTIYEFLLGAGDYELASKVQDYFSKIDNGEKERMNQYEQYRPYIEGMLTQAPYDLSPLIELIKKAPLIEINALLNKDISGETELCKAMIQFRKDWAPRILTKSCMHYNYASLKYAFDILDREWNNLYQASGNNYEKIDLVWRQVIGFEMRRLPGIDRCAMAQSLYHVIEKNEVWARSYTLRYDDGVRDFPVTDCDDSLGGLGWDFAVNAACGMRGTGGDRRNMARLLEAYVGLKLQTWRTYTATDSSTEPLCNILSC